MCNYEFSIRSVQLVFIKKFLMPRLKLEILLVDADLTEYGSEFHMSTIQLKRLNLKVSTVYVIKKQLYHTNTVPVQDHRPLMSLCDHQHQHKVEIS